MGIVVKPENLPPGWDWMTPAQKTAWYDRVRADAVRERGDQADAAAGIAWAIALGIACALLAWGFVISWGLQ